jgi:transposase
MDRTLFRGHIKEGLAPALKPGDIVVMGNLALHKLTGVHAAIEACDAQVWYLPAYSPDPNPIEKLWAKVKAPLRGVAARARCNHRSHRRGIARWP